MPLVIEVGFKACQNAREDRGVLIALRAQAGTSYESLLSLRC